MVPDDSDICEIHTHAMTQDDINSLLSDVYKVKNDQYVAPKNKPGDRGDNDCPTYKMDGFVMK